MFVLILRYVFLSDVSVMGFSDDCLTPKGGKRKLSQVTLFQLNFSRSKARLQSSGLADHPVIKSEADETSTFDANGGSVYIGNGSFAKHEECFISEVNTNDKLALPLIASDTEGCKDELLDDCDVSKVVIPTLIVGRRYGSRESVDPQSRICLSRDPENVKDPNAVKVQFIFFVLLCYFIVLDSIVKDHYGFTRYFV